MQQISRSVAYKGLTIDIIPHGDHGLAVLWPDPGQVYSEVGIKAVVEPTRLPTADDPSRVIEYKVQLVDVGWNQMGVRGNNRYNLKIALADAIRMVEDHVKELFDIKKKQDRKKQKAEHRLAVLTKNRDKFLDEVNLVQLMQEGGDAQ